MAKNFGIVGINEYRGMTLEEAKKLAEQNGFTTRIAEVDGKSLMMSSDVKNNRLNFRVRDNIITEAFPG